MCHFPIIFVIVDFVTSKVIIINRAAVTLASYKFRRCAIFGADWIDGHSQRSPARNWFSSLFVWLVII